MNTPNSSLTLSRPVTLTPPIHLKQPQAHAPLLHAVIESLMDGILIVTEAGHIIHANTCARQICRQLLKDGTADLAVPPEIWQICETLLESRPCFPEQIVVIEDEVAIEDHPVSIRVRVRWLELRTQGRACLLITLEDRYQSARKRAIAEVKQYGLTPREAEVWLLRRANYSYEEIAQKLYIALNTVKKHMKSIYAKRQDRLNSRGLN